MKKELWETLNKPKYIQYELNALDAELIALRMDALPGAIRYDKDAVMSSPDNTFENIMVRIISLEEERRELLDRKLIAIDKAKELLDMIDDGTQRTACYYFFIAQLDADSIADKMGYTSRHVYRLRKDGMKYLDEITTCH